MKAPITSLDELIKELESDQTWKNSVEQARQDIQAHYAEVMRRRRFVREALRLALLAEFVEDWNIRDPGVLANNTADAILSTVLTLLDDSSLTSVIPISTETKVEL